MPQDSGLIQTKDAFPSLARLYQEIDSADPARVRHAFEALVGDDPGIRRAALWTIAEHPGAGPLLERWRRDLPDDVSGGLLAAAHGVTAAWEARSSLSADRVSADQFARFFALLRTAEQGLIALCARHADVADAWYLRLVTSRGLELGESESARRYSRLAAIDPHDWGGASMRLQQVLPKWSRHEDFGPAHSFVHSVVQRNRPDLGLDALYAELFIERYLAAGRTVDKDVEQARTDVDLASDRMLSTAFVSPVVAFDVHSHFGVVHSLLGDRDRAVAHLSRLEHGVLEAATSYLTEKHRAEVVSLHRTARRGGRR